MKTCALCGEAILANPPTPDEGESDEHVPPKLFFPKSTRPKLREQLWTVPAHKKCNNGHREDEEYFWYHMFPMTHNQDKRMANVLLGDLDRRKHHPAVQGMLRLLISGASRMTPGGIALPDSLVHFSYKGARVGRVAVKIAQCLHYRDHAAFLPHEWCTHHQLCLNPTELNEAFTDLLRCREAFTVSPDPDVFRYWHIAYDGLILYAMLFWNSFVYCLLFRNPDAPLPTAPPNESTVK